ncbi:HD domain-containing protein [Neolewinella antarctica]|uniref:Metal-dependent HD superfamily phosphohydrolase n=1 Tax=Neolewinella antarctica TaxID=442734 RepID=A0ABX0XC19_9BACT|nr:HD domain-containing protein [Neolewinella antarctica]NJC26799.1 putative metal-dependent HD superfamily phosphohydrolase [Neolewinella antarctica]
MTNHRKTIVYRAGSHVVRLLRDHLPQDRLFHNVHHTINVVQGVLDIGQAEDATPEELEILTLAAWFHDTGHVKTYAGHELVSISLAEEWLRTQAYPTEKIAEVTRCINATIMPQRPSDRLERIICDADLYHLSFTTYDHYQELLREEWRRELGVELSDEKWRANNDQFLLTHKYWTAFGQQNLEPRKACYC